MKHLNVLFVALTAALAFPGSALAEADVDFSVSTGVNEAGRSLRLDLLHDSRDGRSFGLGYEGGNLTRLRAQFAPFSHVYTKGNAAVGILELDWVASVHDDGDASQTRKIRLAKLQQTRERDLKDDLKLKTELIGAIVYLDQQIEKGEEILKEGGVGLEAGAKVTLKKKLSEMTTAELTLAAKLIGVINDDLDPTQEASAELLLKRQSGIYGGLKTKTSSFGIDSTQERNEFIGLTIGRAF